MNKTIAALTLSITALSAHAEQVNTTGTVLSGEGGNYVFGRLGNTGSQQYMLEIKTGRLWNVVADEGGQKLLQPVPYIDAATGEQEYSIPEPLSSDPIPKTANTINYDLSGFSPD